MINMMKNRQFNQGKISVKPPAKNINEDYLTYASASINPDEEIHIAVIADGMGGYSAGDAASYYAVNFILKWWRSLIWMHRSTEDFFKEYQTGIIDAFKEINHDLIEMGRLEDKKIGTTLSVIIFAESDYYICHVGDTRIYRYRDQILEREQLTEDTIDLNEEKSLLQLTEDHSWATEQIRHGQMGAEEAKSHEKANYLTQCLGVEGEITPYTASGSFTYADFFLLSSDGFHNLFSDRLLREEWYENLSKGMSVQEICDRFYKLTKALKPHDDASILAVNISERAEEE